MDNIAKRSMFLLLVCWISFKGCAAQGIVTVPDANRTLWVEDSSASLYCNATGNPPEVTWSIVSDVIARWSSDDGITIVKSEDKYNMTGDGLKFELIIKNLSLSDAQSYICAVQYGEGLLSFKTTIVTVNDSPHEPYPTITQCPIGNKGNDDCRFVVANQTDTQNLTCRATHFFPNVTLTWSTRVGAVIEPVDVDWHLNNDDGTYCASITITASPQDEAYVCTVTGEALRNVASKTVRAVVQIHEHEPSPRPHITEKDDGGGNSGSVDVGLIIAMVIMACFVLMFLSFLVYAMRVKRRESSSKPKHSYEGLKRGDESVVQYEERLASATKPKTKKDDNWNVSHDVTEMEDLIKKPKEEEKKEKNPEP